MESYSESYLNINSDQFNSWIKEFENKYSKIEQKNEQLINDSVTDTNNESEIDSQIFLKVNDTEESLSLTTDTSFKKRSIFKRTKPIIKSDTKKTETSYSRKIPVSVTTSEQRIIEDKILSLKELNTILPKMNIKKSENILNNNNNIKLPERNKLGEHALYKFIQNRKRI